MTTDADHAFRGWWENKCPTDYDDHERPEKKAAEYAWHAAVDWATARERKKYFDGVRDGSILAFVNYGHDLPDTDDLDCPHCGGSGHKDDVRPRSLTAVDEKDRHTMTTLGGNDPRQNLGSSSRYRDSDIETVQPEPSAELVDSLSAKIASAQAAFNALSPDEQVAHMQRQRESWVKAETELSRLEREDERRANRPEPPADLVKRAGDYWWRVTSDTSDLPLEPGPMLAAFAAEYAAEKDEVWRSTVTVLAEQKYKAECRAEAAENEVTRLRQAIKEKGGTEHAPTEDAYLAACAAIEKHRERAEAAEQALAEEREACAKVAECAFDDRPSLRSNNFNWTDGYYEGTQAAAAIIRARKGGE